jgi:transcriptional regulator with XRE-family HTH domain
MVVGRLKPSDMKPETKITSNNWVADYLKAELAKRVQRNPRYSLRRFAQTLGVSHAYLSMLLAGKKAPSTEFQTRILSRLGLPIKDMLSPQAIGNSPAYALVGPDFLGRELTWYADAILELTRIPKFRLNARAASKRLGISHTQAYQVLESMKRQGLIPEPSSEAIHSTTNESNNETSSESLRRYQKDLLELSMDRLDTLPREKRDHSSMVMSIQEKDLAEFKKLIRDFRISLATFAQRPQTEADRVFCLQVGFFPLDQDSKQKIKRSKMTTKKQKRRTL